MAAIPDAASTVLMGLVLVIVAVGLAYGRNWRRYALGDDGDVFTTIANATQSSTTWIAAFLLAIVGFGGSTLLYLSSTGATQQLALVVLGVLIGVSMTFFLFMGVYQSVKSHGRSTAEAVATGAWALGALLIVVIAVKLLMTA